ncbi:HlyD family type I secretion periplasmic adaptor subunit [Prosthecomicrobium pneumaticum]|uniref:Membrane fusion protein (MFP) family protein n=1 Tax=Prosthecomicrobium pneumaticum TaxID=81895 RepID=A0A7W9L246_9HYPH|nr:HlyD family type I secretion periplasmic adaptor subunit [Prosthecomicrobium pneumaticum]MBB5753219.1 HlyD family secretion protein [Prosthecomicrobium pneumaticum]
MSVKIVKATGRALAAEGKAGPEARAVTPRRSDSPPARAPEGPRPRRASVETPAGRTATTDYRRIEAPSPREPSLRRLVLAGTAAIVFGFGGFFGWAASASLDSAAIAGGTVIVDSKRKTASHLEGGILKRLLVQEGDRVAAGQPLLELDDTRARAELAQLSARRLGLTAKLARLHAEQAGDAEIGFPDALLASDDPMARESVAAEKRFFEQRARAKAGKIDVAQKTIAQHRAEIDSLSEQLVATDRQLALVGEQRDSIGGLVDKGFATRSKLLELEARYAELSGERGELAGNRARAEQALAGAELEIVSVDNDWQSDIAGEITSALVERAEVEERIVAAKDVLSRIVVTAPQEGIVTNIQFRTPGGVVGAGQPLMDIVPENERLIVEMKVSPRDIDSVAAGAKVQVRLTAFNMRSHAPLPGELIYVAADQVTDPATGAAYFIARAAVTPEALAADPSVHLAPGMPADVLILNQPRTALDYLVSPVSESFSRAFREE